MEMRALRYFVGTTAAIGLLLTAAGHAWMQGERATDGKTLEGESAATQAIFQATFGADADREWVAEHNADLARLSPSVPAVPAVPVVPVALSPLPALPAIAMPPDMVMTTPEATIVGPTVTVMMTAATTETAMPTAVTAVTTAVETPGTGTRSGTTGGAPTAAPAPPTLVTGAHATAAALPQQGVPATLIPSCAFAGCGH